MNKAFISPEGREAVLNCYDNLLSGRMTIPHEVSYIDTRLGSTYVLSAGKIGKPAVVLLHGSSMNSLMWAGDMALLSEHYRVYAPEMPGEAGHSAQEQYPFDTMDYVNWLFDVFQALDIDSACVVGASLGAWLAARFAVHHPARTKKLVLLCPAGIGSQHHGFKEIAFSLLSKGEEGVNELFALLNGGNKVPEAFVNYQKLIAGCFNARQEVVPILSDEELRGISMPSLLIVGARDVLLNSDESAERYGRLVPSSEIIIEPDAGHSLIGQSEIIAAFIAK